MTRDPPAQGTRASRSAAPAADRPCVDCLGEAVHPDATGWPSAVRSPSG